MTGRPTKRTDQVVAKVLALVADPVEPLSLRAACSEAGIARSTWHAWEQDDRQLAEDRDIAVGKGQAALERKALDGAVSGPAANVLRHRLARLDMDGWGEVQVRLDGGSVTLTDLAKQDAKPDV